MKSICDIQINGSDFRKETLDFAEYENCTFINCLFNEVDLSSFRFTDCHFELCDLSGVNLENTSFKQVKFSSTKLIGLRFELCDRFLLSFNFYQCQLSYSSFYQLALAGLQFEQCTLIEADFSQANLSGANFEDSDLTGAIFENTNLAKADLSSAFGYTIDPEQNHVKSAKFSYPSVLGLLKKYDIDILQV